jgi:hypothetical protein
MGKGGLGDMMKQVQQMQQKMADMQKQLEEMVVEGSAGGGVVRVIANGKNEIMKITIDPEVVNKDDIEMLQDLVLAAVNQAHEKSQAIQAEQMSSITGGLNIPGLNLPF